MRENFKEDVRTKMAVLRPVISGFRNLIHVLFYLFIHSINIY